MVKKVILISGKAESGKDTLADLLTNVCQENGNNVLVIHYADILKFVCSKYLNWDGNKDEVGRQLLQHIGTDVARNNHENVWVNCVIELVKGLKTEYDYIIIPDCRFPNEVEAWYNTEFDTVSIRIVRYNENGDIYQNHLTQEQQKHPSEIALDDWSFDYEVENKGLEDLRDSARIIYEDLEFTVINEEGE